MKRFKSRDGLTKRLIYGGEVCLVGNEFREIPQHFESAAYAGGCISDDMVMKAALTTEYSQKVMDAMQNRVESSTKVRDIIKGWCILGDATKFYKGAPTLKAIRNEFGFGVEFGQQERNTVWRGLVEEGFKAPEPAK